MKLVYSFTLLMAISLSSAAQTYLYEAFIEGYKVGETKVVREVNDESEKIAVTTKVIGSGNIDFRMKLQSHSSYMDGQLMDATSVYAINGTTTETQITYKNGGYHIRLDHESIRLEEALLYGSDLLFFELPEDINQIYLPDSGALTALNKTGEQSWQYQNQGQQWTYLYKQGRLMAITVDLKSSRLVFKRKK